MGIFIPFTVYLKIFNTKEKRKFVVIQLKRKLLIRNIFEEVGSFNILFFSQKHLSCQNDKITKVGGVTLMCGNNLLLDK